MPASAFVAAPGAKSCRGRSAAMPTAEERARRRERQTAEVEASQARLRASIAETERLVGESDEMLRRHRQETDEEEGSEGSE